MTGDADDSGDADGSSGRGAQPVADEVLAHRVERPEVVMVGEDDSWHAFVILVDAAAVADRESARSQEARDGSRSHAGASGRHRAVEEARA
jgi:hypothetical protein